MTRVTLAGATGWVGRPLAEAIGGASGRRLVAAVARRARGEQFQTRTVRGSGGWRPLLLLPLFALLATSLSASQIPDSTLDIGHASIRIRFSRAVSQPYRRAIEEWVTGAANAVLTVYERFPVPRVTVAVQVTEGSGVAQGVTYAGERIRVIVGSRSTREALRSDWVMTHEMFHLGFPDIEEGRDWIGEGLSTYLEPLARARAGQLSEEEVWRGFLEGAPQGLPHSGDAGLDRTPTWGRTYWGGALFWLVADLEIRKQSGNRKSLDDALRAIAAEGGNGSATWPAERVFQRGDAAIGLPVLELLHEKMGSKADRVDLPQLWKQLGIAMRGGRVVFAPDAPLSTIRRALTERR